MKITTVLTSLLMIVLLATFAGCKKDSDTMDPTLQMLTSGTWQGVSVEMDAVDKSKLFTGFNLTFTSTSYSAVNGLGIWPDNGTWSFTDDSKKSITRSDGALIAITSITENELVLSFTWNPAFKGGRTTSVGGNYVFRLRQ